ncbi:LysR substrate-binding domain-containing protein [Catenuloplanes japonicus]|uniref:LysR substrate-binding domain-containing protein n=1 Tax=Catenuloplanes japonicus TaxID=33876 RepID=UPI0012FCEC8E
MEQLFTDDVVCVVDRDHPVRDRFSLTEYVAARHVTVNVVSQEQPMIEHWPQNLGHNRIAAVRVTYFTAAVHAVRGTALVATLPRRLVEHQAENDPRLRMVARAPALPGEPQERGAVGLDAQVREDAAGEGARLRVGDLPVGVGVKAGQRIGGDDDPGGQADLDADRSRRWCQVRRVRVGVERVRRRRRRGQQHADRRQKRAPGPASGEVDDRQIEHGRKGAGPPGRLPTRFADASHARCGWRRRSRIRCCTASPRARRRSGCGGRASV